MLKYLQHITIFALTIFVISANPAIAQPPKPTLLCLSVQDDGSILANWTVENGTFTGFRLYYSLANYNPPPDPPPPIHTIDDIESTALSIRIPVDNANVEQYEVFIITYTGTQTNQSQKLKTIQPLVYQQVGSQGGVAIIEWGSMNNTTSTIYRSSDNHVTYPLLDQTSTNNYTDVIAGICNDTDLHYYIEFTNDNCTFRSMTASISDMSDKTAPDDPIFEYITIIDNLAVLHWSHSSSADLAGYQIEVYNDASGWEEHAILGIQNSFTDDLVNNPSHPFYQNPCTQVVKYVLKAVDECGNSSAGNVYDDGSIHNTLWLRLDLEAECNRKATLKWNRYNNMHPGVSSYNIYRSMNGAQADSVGTIEDNGSQEFSFTDDFLEPGVPYTYHISAVNAENDITSESCRVEVVADPELLEEFYLDYLTVHNNEYVQLSGNGSPYDIINKVAIYRSATTPDALELLTELPWKSEEMVIDESTAEVKETAYYYQLFALDECGYKMDSSIVMRSIYLQLEDMGDDRVRLNWNELEGWEGILAGYDVYRMTDGITDPDFPRFESPGSLVFNDVIDPLTTNGRITYYVEAFRNDPVTSRSNEVLVLGEAEILMPNAFRPDSENELNNIFTPFVKNVDSSNYRLVIYNRWGHIVFETNDPQLGWDGKIKGQISSSGIFAYVVTYADYNGITHSQRGAVNLLR